MTLAIVIAAVLLVAVGGIHRGQAADDPIEIRKGLFLIAEPGLRDSHFSETVVLIVEHGERGTTGVVINRSTATPLARVFPERRELDGRSETLYAGGPVNTQALLLLVRSRARLEHAQRVFGDVYVSQATEALFEALKSDDATTAVRLFAGYAGWAPGQLAEEVARGGWRVVPADAVVLFDRDPEVVWKEMIRRTSERFI